MSASEPMSATEALRALHAVRTDEIVLTSMGSARDWQQFEPHPLDFIHVPSSMGQTQSFALGLALADVNRRVIACCGEGSLLMNPGSLVTITAVAASNLVVVVLDNQGYEVTGYQPTNATPSARRDATRCDFAALARACGFQAVHSFSRLDVWVESVAQVIRDPGPVFVCLAVTGGPDGGPPPFPGPGPERARDLRRLLSSADRTGND